MRAEMMPKKSKADEVDVLDAMIASSAEPLEEKGVISQDEWDSASRRI